MAEQNFWLDTGIGDEIRQRLGARKCWKFVALRVPETSFYANMISTISFDE
jgi:hypothetical protein